MLAVLAQEQTMLKVLGERVEQVPEQSHHHQNRRHKIQLGERIFRLRHLSRRCRLHWGIVRLHLQK